jgi:hypothetical protein
MTLRSYQYVSHTIQSIVEQSVAKIKQNGGLVFCLKERATRGKLLIF